MSCCRVSQGTIWVERRTGQVVCTSTHPYPSDQARGDSETFSEHISSSTQATSVTYIMVSTLKTFPLLHSERALLHITVNSHGVLCVQVMDLGPTFRSWLSVSAGRTVRALCCGSGTSPDWSSTTAYPWEFRVGTGRSHVQDQH